jgi:molecular chaperone DnaK (HSP70)
MKLGVDFGTNRTVVAAADRGNYPLVSFDSSDGSSSDWFPSLAAVRGDERLFGWDAWAVQTDESWTVIRSIKRLLEDAGPQTVLELGSQRVFLSELLNGFTRALFNAIRESSNLNAGSDEQLQAVLGVPAHANSNQRFLTTEAFRRSGFEVLGVLNEPSAASIEFGHRQRERKSERQTILVYDLGGGTFDASLVTLDEKVHHVVASEGIPTIGGDDFDQLLADLALAAAGVSEDERDGLSAAKWFRLLEECRTKKEALNPNSRKLLIDLEQVNPDWGSVQVSVTDFFERARPLMEETLAVAEELANEHCNGDVEALYITGGASELPLVARVLRERFGRRVRRSAYTRSATAIGLAIQADEPETYRLSERLARYFGVWRETDHGTRIVFDPLFPKGLQLPAPGEPNDEIRRNYHPAHNIGHFRFLECSHRSLDGTPSGEVTLWDEIRFPFDPALSNPEDLANVPVTLSEAAGDQRIEELYECDSSGSIRFTIANRTAEYTRTFPLGHWNTDQKSVKPGATRSLSKTKKQSA